MRLLNQDPVNGSMELQIETEDDIWHLFNVIEVNDILTGSTTRRDEKAADKLRAERAEKKRMTLSVRAEKIEFSDSELRLRILGTITDGPQDIGQYHTLMFEVGETLIITKERWRDTQLERLRKAVFESKRPMVVFVSLDQDDATIAVLRQFGLKEVASVRSMRSGKQYQEKNTASTYHDEIISKLMSTMEDGMPLVILGPGFEKELLAETGKREMPGIFAKAHIHHTGQSGMPGVNELLKKGMGANILRESRVAAEMEAVEKLMEEIGKNGLATYGPKHAEDAAASGSVSTLLILDSLIRVKDHDVVVKNVEEQKGNVIIVSEQHDAGRQLAALGGIAAILRYRTE
ncbi:MAG: mRNA surveillance protein pelota [Methanomassiliicoccaceae archaeon]|jgi:protein pelota|nr:mRNA surveillance protein pelota [Methanomassiliicoccaceae archaeon]